VRVPSPLAEITLPAPMLLIDAAPTTAKRDIISLLDKELLRLFKLPEKRYLVHEINDLLTRTKHGAPIPLRKYENPLWALDLKNALQTYLAKGLFFPKRLDEDNIFIIPESKDNPEPDIPFHALVYADSRLGHVYIHERFFPWLAAYAQAQSLPMKDCCEGRRDWTK